MCLLSRARSTRITYDTFYPLFLWWVRPIGPFVLYRWNPLWMDNGTAGKTAAERFGFPFAKLPVGSVIHYALPLPLSLPLLWPRPRTHRLKWELFCTLVEEQQCNYNSGTVPECWLTKRTNWDTGASNLSDSTVQYCMQTLADIRSVWAMEIDIEFGWGDIDKESQWYGPGHELGAWNPGQLCQLECREIVAHGDTLVFGSWHNSLWCFDATLFTMYSYCHQS